MFCLITYKLRVQLITFNCSLDNMIILCTNDDFFAQFKRLKLLPLIKTIIASIVKSSVIPYRKKRYREMYQVTTFARETPAYYLISTINFTVKLL